MVVAELPQPQRTQLADVITTVVQQELCRADVVSHFALAADLIRTDAVNAGAFQGWRGRVVVLSAVNDPTQRKNDIPRYERLFGRRINEITLGRLGHAAVLVNPKAYTDILERALS